MQFLVMGYDGADEGALARRMAAREKHLAGAEQLIKAGRILYGAAMLNERGEMAGSMIVTDFPDREGLDAWLKTEPYVTGDVWRRVEIVPCKVPPMFQKP